MEAAIRPATAEDAAAIAAVHASSWRWAYRGTLDDAVLDELTPTSRLEMWQAWFETPARGHALEVAVLDGEVVGFVEVGPAGAGEASSAEVHALYLAADRAGQGLGSLLLDAGRADLVRHGFDRAILWVLAANRPARAFYEHRGWMPDGASDTYEIGGRTYPIVRYATAL